MARIRVRTILDATPAEVWADLEDIASHSDWMADAVGIRFLTAQTSGVGTRFECDTKVGPFRLTDVMEITEWSPGRAMGVTHTGLVTGSGRFTLKRARGGRTAFQWRERLRFPLWMGGPLGALASKPVLTRVWRRSMRNLQARF
ncbi:MAG: SRPBCC family protein [Microthrixaceae bacterium]